MAAVRGIGVAVITSTSGTGPPPAFAFSAARCSTPKRCCSSITTTPRLWNATASWISAWVPTSRSTSPAARAVSTRCRSLPVTRLVSSSTVSGRSPNSDAPSSGTVMPSSIGRMLARCCSASTSVGAMKAPWWPPCTAVSSAATATTVLPAPDVALQQPVHRDRTSEVGGDLGDHLGLVARELEGERAEEPRHQGARRVVLDALAGGLDHALAQHEGELDPQQLVEHEPAAGLLGLAHRLGDVDAAERRGAIDEVVAVEHPSRHRLDELTGAAQRLGHPAAEVLRVEAQLVGLRVDRGDLQAVVLVEEVDLRVGHLLLAPVLGDLAEEQRLGALGELPGPPRLVEERDPQVARAVGDPELGARLARVPGRGRWPTTAPARTPSRLVDLEVADRRLLRLVDVAARVVRQQVEDRSRPRSGPATWPAPGRRPSAP